MSRLEIGEYGLLSSRQRPSLFIHKEPHYSRKPERDLIILALCRSIANLRVRNLPIPHEAYAQLKYLQSIRN